MTPINNYHAIIFGGGLAGSLLADRFRSAGKRILLVDQPDLSRCSRVAAGIVNPIGGKRLKRVWNADELIPAALRRYASLARTYQRPFFHPRPIARLFANRDEERLWQRKRASDPNYQAMVAPLDALALPAAFANDRGFAIPQSGYLDTAGLIACIHQSLSDSGCLLYSKFDYNEIKIAPRSVAFRQATASYAIFAEGHLATLNPWFAFAPFKPAKGVIASVVFDPPILPTNAPIILKGKFLLPRSDGEILLGATYRWDQADDSPDPQGAAELESFLASTFGRDGWRIKAHRTGVRPATAGAYPVVGPHPELPQLLAFNGFGSKGSLQIPAFAEALFDFLDQEKPLPSETLPSRFRSAPKTKPKRWIATEVARTVVESCLGPASLAVDATAGNGHDTAWLAEAVGPDGRVFAFDIQERALVATRERLRQTNRLDRVALFQSSHHRLDETLPPDVHGKLDAIVFNLGFLPGGDSGLITKADTTLPALQSAARHLRPGGILAVTLYPGHPGAAEEVEAALAWLRDLPSSDFQTWIEPHPQRNPNSPYPIFAKRR